MVKYYPQANKYYVHNSISTLMVSHIWFGKNKSGSNPEMNLNIIRGVYKLKLNRSVWEWFFTLSDQFKFRSWKNSWSVSFKLYSNTTEHHGYMGCWKVSDRIAVCSLKCTVKTLCARYTFFWMSNHTLSPNMAAQLANDLGIYQALFSITL